MKEIEELKKGALELLKGKPRERLTFALFGDTYYLKKDAEKVAFNKI